MRLLPLVLFVTVCSSPIFAQEVARLDRATQDKIEGIVGEISAAMKAEETAEVRRRSQQAIELSGDQAGLPESPDEYRAVPDDARPLTANELPTAFDDYIPYIKKQRWWRIGLDPSTTSHSLREVATVIEGCLGARQVSDANSKNP